MAGFPTAIQAATIQAGGVVVGGADNWSYLQGLINNLPATGGVIQLPTGIIAISQPLVMKQGTHLLGTAKLQPTNDGGGLLNTALGTWIAPTNGFAIGAVSPQLALIYNNTADCTLERINMTSNGAATPLAYIHYGDVNASDFSMINCSWQGVITTSSTFHAGPRTNLTDCYGNCQANAGTIQTLNWQAPDGKILGCRFKAGVMLFNNSGNIVIGNGHFTGGSPGVQFTGAGTIHWSNTVIDSAQGTAMILHAGSGGIHMTNVNLYSQVINGFAAIQKTGTGYFHVVGLNAASDSLAHAWTNLYTGMGAADIFLGINIDTNSISGAITGDASVPGVLDIVNIGGTPRILQSQALGLAANVALVAATQTTLITLTLTPGLYELKAKALVLAGAVLAPIDIAIIAGTATLVGAGGGATAGDTLSPAVVTTGLATGSAQLQCKCTVGGTVLLVAESAQIATFQKSTNGDLAPVAPATYFSAIPLMS